MPAPALLAVDLDPELGRIERELRDRYEGSYRIICTPSPDEALSTLAELADAGDEVALVLAGQWLSGTTGGELLDRAYQLHPHAKRGLLVAWGDWGHIPTAKAIFDSMALGLIDYYLLRPTASPDELFHHAISSFLLEWTEARRIAPHTVRVIGEAWEGRAHELRSTLQRCAIPHAFYLSESREGRSALAEAGPGALLPLIILPDGLGETCQSWASGLLLARERGRLVRKPGGLVVFGSRRPRRKSSVRSPTGVGDHRLAVIENKTTKGALEGEVRRTRSSGLEPRGQAGPRQIRLRRRRTGRLRTASLNGALALGQNGGTDSMRAVSVPELEREGTRSPIWLAFIPWLAFAVISRRDTPEAAVVVGLIAAVAVALPGIRAGRPKILELSTIGFFVLFGVIVIAADPGPDDFLVRYGRAIATAGLALIAFGSLAFGVPFTEQYAREQVDESKWDSPVFHALNRRITALWGGAFVVMACSHVLAGAIDTRRADTLFNWGVPIVLVVLVLRYMESAEANVKPSAPPPAA